MQRGWLGQQILRSQRVPTIQSRWELLTNKVFRKIDWRKLRKRLFVSLTPRKMTVASAIPVTQSACCVATAADIEQLLNKYREELLPVDVCHIIF